MNEIITEIERKLTEFWQSEPEGFVKREGNIAQGDRTVSILAGARRTGKSVRALQFATELTGAEVQDICFIDFDNPILSEMKARDLGQIVITFLKLRKQPSSNLVVFLFDEIHRIKKWEDFVIDLSRNPKHKVVVTGSSSKLMQGDIATSLRGKSITTRQFPFSFPEHLLAYRVDASDRSALGIAKIKKAFDDYLVWGALPAVHRFETQFREVLLREYFDVMLIKDIINRNNVSKPEQCTFFLRDALTHMSRPFTQKAAYERIKQRGFKTSKDSVAEYLDYAKEAFLFEEVPIFAKSIKEEAVNYSKIYPIDWALAHYNSFHWDGGLSRSLECLVYTELLRQGLTARFYLTKTQRQEVDFIVTNARGKQVGLIQVCESLNDSLTLQRELAPLSATAKYFGLKEALILTLEEDREMQIDNICVLVRPVWKWLLTPTLI